MERLGRGVVAMRKSEKEVFISWRLLGLDPPGISFDLYRATEGESPVKLNRTPLRGGTNFTDSNATLSKPNVYFVRPIIGSSEQEASTPYMLPANAAIGPVFRIPLQAPHGRAVRHCWVGDLDGDGEYEFIVSMVARTIGPDETDAENEHKPQGGTGASGTGRSQQIAAYKRDGTFLWKVDFGPLSADSHRIYVKAAVIGIGQADGVTVYDMDSDGRAEVIVKSANGVTFGDGTALEHHDDVTQFISVLDGKTGAERARQVLPNPWRRDSRDREDRPLAVLFGVGYPDGVAPSLMIHAKNRRGRSGSPFNVINSAWDFRDGTLSQRWSLQWEGGDPSMPPEAHQMRIIDVDGDGKDELIPGMHVITPEGKVLYSLGDQGIIHGDRFHIGDLDPGRPGLEGYGIQQKNKSGVVEYFHDARTGKILWDVNIGRIADAARGTAADVDPRYPGCEVWSFYGMRSAQNELILKNDPVRPWPNLRIWWDGDVLAECLNENKLEKWNYDKHKVIRLMNIGVYGGAVDDRTVPAFYGDILGDWREEMVYHNSDHSELVVFTTTDPTDVRLYTLPHNPAYRNCMTLKGYFQSNWPDYFLGHDMKTPPAPNIAYVDPGTSNSPNR